MQQIMVRALVVLWGVGLSLAAGLAQALVLHPDGSGVAATPPDAVVGLWNIDPSNENMNGSAVAIAPEYALLSRHQGGSLSRGTQVTFGGVTYHVAEFIEAPNMEDIRLARLETLAGDPAQLTEFVPIYTASQEVGQTVVMGGFGLGRGDAITRRPGPNAPTVGYEWAGPKTLRWGANVVSASENNTEFEINSRDLVNDTLLATFESPGNGVAGEATLADSDSGGGWFVFENDQWLLVAISQAVEDEDTNNPVDQALFSPSETMWGVRVSSYSTFINSSILDLGDLNGDGAVTNGDISPFVLALTAPQDYANQFPGLDPDIVGDLNGDGTLTNGDISGFVALLTSSGAMTTSEAVSFTSAVPEPTSLVLLVCAGLACSSRRRS